MIDFSDLTIMLSTIMAVIFLLAATAAIVLGFYRSSIVFVALTLISFMITFRGLKNGV